MKILTPSFAMFAAAMLVTLAFPAGALSQSQDAGVERAKTAPKIVNAQRSHYRTVDTRCHSYGGYGWGPYWGPCPYRGEVFGAAPTTPVLPFLPFGPFW